MDFCLNNAFAQHDPKDVEAVKKKVDGDKSKTGLTEAETNGMNGHTNALTNSVTTGVDAASTPSVSAQQEVSIQQKAEKDPEGLSPEELKILNTLRAREMLRSEDVLNVDNFSTDAIDGLRPLVKRGMLTLVESSATSHSSAPTRVKKDVYNAMTYEKPRTAEVQG